MNPPVFGHGSLRLYLLSLLADGGKHGYELIQAIEQRFGGTYSPSAGTIYPRLAKLEEDGLVTKTADGRKTVYEITDAGRLELERRQSELADIEAEVTDSVRRLADEVRAGVNRALSSLRADLASAARESKQQARNVPPNAAPAPGGDPFVSARFALREAELALSEFRQELRGDLRERAARGKLTDASVTALRAELARVRAALRDEWNR